MKATPNQTNVAAGALGFGVCLWIFFVALQQQLGLVAAIASLAAWAQLFIVIASVGDAFSNLQAGSRMRAAAAATIALLVAFIYMIANRR